MTTIRRQYSLPNCQLVLEGLLDETVASQTTGRPLMSILVNAECYFTGADKRLNGGRSFFESLVKAVSAYAQEFLSGVHHPLAHQTDADTVSFVKIDEQNLHRLVWQPGQDDRPAAGTPNPVELDLTSVQLFDLVEAVDQFLADARTLPDLSLQVEPVSKRYRQADVPIARRVAPAVVGVSSLAIAASLFYFVPIPKVIEPEPPKQETTASESPTEGATPAPGASPTPEEQPTTAESPLEEPLSPEELDEFLAEASKIDDPTELRFLERNLRRRLEGAWRDRDRVQQKLEYRVSVAQDGSIVSYESLSGTPAQAVELTPLEAEQYTPTNLGRQEAIGEFRVVFTNRSVLQISPWDGYQGKWTFGPEITDSQVLQELNDRLYDTLRKAWSDPDPSFNKSLEFRVGATEDGFIADYEADNQSAFDYEEETPLPKLLKPEAAGIEEGGSVVPQKPLGQFKVVFKPNGVLEVSPVRGF